VPRSHRTPELILQYFISWGHATLWWFSLGCLAHQEYFVWTTSLHLENTHDSFQASRESHSYSSTTLGYLEFRQLLTKLNTLYYLSMHPWKKEQIRKKMKTNTKVVHVTIPVVTTTSDWTQKSFFFLSKKVTTITIKPHNLTSSMMHTDQATDKNDPTYYHIMQLDEACDNQLDKQNDYPPNTRKTTPRR